jgi:hypothetical protein
MLTDPIDGLPCEEVNKWALEKHRTLEEYIRLSHGARQQFL